MKKILSVIKWFAGVLAELCMMLVRGFVVFLKATWQFTLSYIRLVNNFTSAPTPGGSKKLFSNAFIRYGFRLFLYALTPLMFLTVPAGVVVTVAAVLIAIDQATYPTYTVNPQFINIAKEIDGKRPELKDVGATIFTATYQQMENELDSMFGWTPNDKLGFQFFDNKVNRQLGVLHASRELLEATSIAISKFGSRDEEDQRLVAARQESFALDPYKWFMPIVEGEYRNGITQIKRYQDDLRHGNVQNARINITNTNIESILLAIHSRVLEVPHGRLNARSFEVSWFDLDDRVFFAQGAAIVARDALVALRYAFEPKIAEAGALGNLDQAIASLEGAIAFNPWWVMKGDADAMFADHRAKMSRYYSDARERIIDVASAINR